MATVRWRGDAVAVAQVVTITITADDSNTTYTVTINGKLVSVTGSGTGVNATAAKLQAALAASTIPEFQEVTWTVTNAIVTGTATVAGKPFTASSSVTGGTGTIGAVTTTTSSSGPNDVSVPANWSTGNLPAGADDVYFDLSNVDALYGLSVLAGLTLNSLNIPASYTGNIGLTQLNSGGYFEYRQIYFQAAATTTNIGYGPGAGSGRIKIDSQAIQTTVLISNTANGNEGGVGAYAVHWKGTNANNLIQILKGSIGIAPRPGETATVLTLDVGYSQNVLGDATVFCGSGATITNINQTGGSLTVNSGFTTLSKTAGTITVMGNAVNITTMTIDGGQGYYNGTGTITTLNVGNAGEMYFTQDLRARNVTNTSLYKGAKLIDSFGTVAWGAGGIALKRCRLTEVTIDLGENRTLLTFA